MVKRKHSTEHCSCGGCKEREEKVRRLKRELREKQERIEQLKKAHREAGISG